MRNTAVLGARGGHKSSRRKVAGSARHSLLRARSVPVRILPLGSPTARSNRLFRVLCMTMTASVRWVVYPGWCTWVGAWEGAYRVLPTHPPWIPVHWYCQGPTHAQNPVIGHGKALQGPAGPSAHLTSPALDIPALEPIKARFRPYNTKVSP